MSKSVLIVDDERDCLELASISLSLFGEWKVYQAVDGKTALEKVREVRPDVVLLDFYLQDTTGAEVLKEMRRDPTLKDIPAVIYSGSPQDARIALEGVPNIEILAKPLNPDSLCAAVSRVCGLPPP